MKDSMQSAITPRAFDCGHIEAAHQRVEEMRTSPVRTLEPPTLLELEQTLGGKVEKCELWTTNWPHRVHRVKLASGGAVLAKQVLIWTDGMLQYQYDQLGVLARLQISRVARAKSAPKALTLLREKRLRVMEFARGKTIQPLVLG